MAYGALKAAIIVGLPIIVAAGAGPSTARPELLLPVADVSPADVPPRHPFTRDPSGVFARTLFSGAGPNNVGISVLDVMIGPARTQQIPALPGPAIIEWFEGHGTFSVASGPPQTIGNEFQVIPSGQPITVNNPNRPPVGFRLYIFAGG
jgi:hypothetical protein